MNYKVLSCNENYSKNFMKQFFLKKTIQKHIKFSNDINKFILLLRKGVYPYEVTDDWENYINETTLPE